LLVLRDYKKKRKKKSNNRIYMSKLFDLNPEEKEQKIKLIVNESIIKKQKQLDNVSKELESLKNQEQENKYFMNLNEDPQLTVSYVGVAVISLIGDILEGFGEVTKRIKKDLESQIQTGGAETNSSEELKKQADNLNQVIGEAQKLIENLKKEKISSKSLGPGTVQGEFKKGLNKAKNMGIAAFKTGVKWSEQFINQMIDLSMEASGQGKLLNTPLDELSPELNKKLLLLAGVLKELSTNPATKEAVKQIAEAIGTSMVELMEQIKPQIEKVTDEAIAMIDQVAEKTARGSMATGVSVAQAFLAEIPWVGGIIDFFLAIGKGFNSFMEVVKTFSNKTGDLAVKNAKLVKGAEDSVKAGINRIQTALNKAKQTLEESQGKAEIPTPTTEEGIKPPITSDIETPTTATVKKKTTEEIKKEGEKNARLGTDKTSSQAGGSKREYIPDRKIRNKIQKAGKRLRKTLKIFNKTLPKLNYSLKINDKKHVKKTHKKKYTRKHLV